MIRVYLVRHGIAGESPLDESRTLTDKGRRRFRRAARAFARMEEPVNAIFTSPLVRAVQTAEILAGALKVARVQVLEELRFEHPPKAVLAALARQVKDGEAVALVGHEPQMSGLLAALAQLGPERLEVRKGSILRVDVDALPPSSAEFKWWMKPKSRTLSTEPPRPPRRKT